MTTYTLGSDNNRAGDSGERYMQRALEESGITSYYRTFFGLGVLGMSNDVDWAILNGSYMLYGDTKKQRIAGNRLYTKDGQLFNGDDFRHSTQPSQGMQAAVDRTRGALPDAKVEAMIVFTPSNGRPDESIDVREARWPDDIPVYSAAEALTEILRRLGPPAPPDQRNIEFAEERIEQLRLRRLSQQSQMNQSGGER